MLSLKSNIFNKIVFLSLSLLSTNLFAALPTSGVCGFIVTLPHPSVELKGITTPTATDILGSIDFANKTINYNMTTFYYNGSYLSLFHVAVTVKDVGLL